jgi:hypothetical protein
MRNSYLLSHSNACAALCAGGIVAGKSCPMSWYCLDHLKPCWMVSRQSSPAAPHVYILASNFGLQLLRATENAEDAEQANSVSGPEPRTFKQAMHCPQSSRWRDVTKIWVLSSPFWRSISASRIRFK